MNTEVADTLADEYGEPFVQMDGFDDCIIGVALASGRLPTLCYSVNKVLDRLIKDGMSMEESIEFFEYNILSAYMGNNMPVFLEEK
jgi:hypothetical protein